MTAFTFDTGALIAFERRNQRMMNVFRTARLNGTPMIVPGVCVAEWWRGRSDAREELLEAVVVRHSDDLLMKTAGEALGAIPRATCIDAIVMATAASYGGAVFTSDVDDLMRLQQYFPSIRVLSV